MSYLPDMGGGQNQNPFYNPYSSKPDYFGGIAATIQNYMMAKQEQEDRQLKMQQAEMLRQQQSQQQAIENELKRAQIEKLLRPVAPDEPDFIKQARAYSTYSGMPFEEAVKKFAPFKDTENTPSPTTYDKQTGAAAKALKEGRITQAQYDAIEMGMPDPASSDVAGDKELKTYDADVAGDEKRINLAIRKYDGEITKLDAKVRKAEGQLAEVDNDASLDDKAKEPKKKFYEAELMAAKNELDNLNRMKEHLVSIGESVGLGQRLSNKQRAELMAAIAGTGEAKKNPEFFRGSDYQGFAKGLNESVAKDVAAEGPVATPPTPRAGTPRGTRQQNKRTGEWWSWDGNMWNKVR
jgi:hypothetical protein